MAIKKSWITHLVDDSPEWHDFRQDHLGASEISTVCGLSEYAPTAMQLFHVKVGTERRDFIMNEPIFHGKRLEEYVADCWRYYDSPGDSYIHNATANRVQRQCRNINGAIVNPKYPFLSCNLDRVVVKGSRMLNENAMLCGDISEDQFPLECKTINQYSAKRWEDGIPRGYIYQVQQQLVITESKYAEIVLLIDGRNLKVFPVYADKHIQQEILDKGSDFWNLVKIGRQWYGLYLEAISLGDEQKAQEYLAKISEFEPEPDNSPAYLEYFTDRHKVEEESMMSDDRLYELAIQHKRISSLKKAIEDAETTLGNQIRYAFVQNRVERINLPNGHLKYSLRKGGVNKTLHNGASKPSEMEVAIMKELVLKESRVDISLLES